MLCKPWPNSNELKRVAIGYKNPLCLTRAKQAQPALYNGHEIIKDNHIQAIVYNSKDTLEIAEITRKKINDKMNDPECVTRKVKITPHDYSKVNILATFTPQKQLTPEQIIWSNDLMKIKSEALKERTKVLRPIKAFMVYPLNTPATLVPKVLPTKSQVKILIFTLIQLFSEFDQTCKKKITPSAITDGERGFEQTKVRYLQEVIPFFKTLKDNFESIQKALTKEVKEMKDVFEELEAEVAQHSVDSKHDAIELKNLFIANDNLIVECLSQEVFCVATNSELNVARFTDMHVANTTVEIRCLALEAELANLRKTNNQDNQTELINHFSKLEVTHLQVQNDLFRAENDKIKQHYKELYDSIKITRAKHIEQMLEPIVPRLKNDRNAHLDYLRHLKESVETIQDIVEEAKVIRPLDRSIVSACRVDCCLIASGSQPMSRVKPNKISPAKRDTKLPIDDQPRKNKSHLRTSTRIDSSSRLKRTVINSHSDSVCQTCAKCLTPFNHDLCVDTCLQSAMATPSIHYNHSVERKVKQVWKPKQVKQVWKPTGKVLTTIGHQWRPTSRIFDLGNQCPLTKFTPPNVVYATQYTKRASPCSNQKEPNQNWGSNLLNSPSLSGFKCSSYRLSFDKMADVNAPSDQTPTMAPPVRVDDQILPHIRWILIGKSNCYLDLEKSQSNPIYKIAVDLLKNTNFFRAFTASSNLPSIYIQQFWDTILYDKKAGCYKCQLDEQCIRFTKPIIHHLQRKHRFHPRPNSPLHMSNEEPVLRYLKFSAKGTKREIFGMTIPSRLITTNIREASYYQEYQENAAKHRGFLAGETGSTQDLPAPKPAKPARKPQSTVQKAPPKPSIPSLVISTQPAPTSFPAKTQENKRKQATGTTDKPAKAKRIKRCGGKHERRICLPKGPLPPVVIREPESGKYQPLPEVPGKGKAKVSEEQAGPEPDVQLEDQMGSDAGAQAEGQDRSNSDETSEGQARSNPDETSKGQAGPDLGNAEDRVQSTLSPVVHVGSDREHMDLDVANVSPQPSTEQLYEGFIATVYPNVQENLKLVVQEPVLLEEPASSSGTLSSLQHLKTEVESMVNVPIQQALPSISLMTSPIIDLTSRLESPKEHQQLKATTTDTTTTTTTTTLPPPQALQQSTTAMQAPLCNRFRDLPEADMKEILHQRMWESDSYKSHEDHMQLFEALEKSINRDHSEELPPPPPPPVGPSGTSGAPRASGSQVTPPPPPTSTNQDSLSKGSAAPSPAKTAATTEHQAWSTPDVTLKPLVSWTPEDLDMDEAMEERPTTPEPAWSIRSSDVPVPTNNWALTLASNYSPPPKDSLLVQTGDITTFMDWFCKRRGITELKPQDLEGPAYEIVKVFHPDVIHLQYQMEESGNLRYGSKGRRPALSVSKMKATYYLNAGLEQMVPDQFWIEEECKYDTAVITVTTHMRILSVVRIEVFSMYGYDYMKKIVLRRTDLNEHVIAERDFKYLYPSDFEDLNLLNLQGQLNHLPPKDKKILTTAVNLTKPQWTATGFEYKHDYTVIESPRDVIFGDKYGVQMMMRFNEIRKFSDRTLQQIVEALDYRVKEFRINRMNPGLNTRFWTKKDVDRCNAFMFAILRHLRTWRIFCNLESFVGGRVREGDYRLLRRTD
nr:integrase, catalytic region, zinc finger, CCHC-type, peptidase aspartic, catalytic [Tanacetum cinerariifolium]